MAFDLSNIQRVEFEKKKKQTSSILKKEIVLFNNTFSNKIKEDFYIELSVLLNAGVSMKNALELLAKSQKKKQNKDVLNSILTDLIEGKSLSESIKPLKWFSSYEYHSLKIGEETGRITQISEQLGDFYARKNEQRRNLVNGLTYPVIILTTAILVVVFMLQFVVPMFQDIFKQQNVELPGVTLFVISLSSTVKEYGWLILVFIVGIFLSTKFLGQNPYFLRYKDNLLSRIPYVGHFIKSIYLSQFTQAVALLTASKVPIVNSIKLVRQMINYQPLVKALEVVEKELLKGKSMSESLSEHKIFDSKMLALIKVAEETNQTEYIFNRLNKQYNTHVQQQSKLMSTVMEPLIIVVVGVFVGFILVAMYLPMFRLSSVIG